jgi:hypothetical protein
VAIAAKSAKECVCKEGFYDCPAGGECDTTKSEDVIPPGCLVCPNGGDCTSLGTNLELLGTSKGYWRAADATLVFHSCNPLTCIGSPKGTSFDRDQQCKNGHVGLLCSICDAEKGYVKQTFGDSCVQCRKNEGLWTVLTLLTVLILIVGGILGITTALHRRHTAGSSPIGISSSIRALKQGHVDLSSALSARNMPFKTFIGAIQVIGAIPASFRVLYPEPVMAFFRLISHLDIFDIFGFATNFGCVYSADYYTIFCINTLGPLMVLMLLVLLFLALRSSHSRKLQAVATGAANAALFFSIIVYPGMTTRMFNVFDCRTYEDEEAYLVDAPQIKCTDASYREASDFWSARSRL